MSSLDEEERGVAGLGGVAIEDSFSLDELFWLDECLRFLVVFSGEVSLDDD